MLNILKKWLSHHDQLAQSQVHKSVTCDIGMPKPKTVFDDKTGRIVNSVDFDFDYSPDANLKVSDFALENLLACGANLSELSMDISGFKSADSAIDIVNSHVQPSQN